ncbi:hypothetical protein PHAVU_007G220000 [Phaseolus vulgaris]|uniref:Uncharacterized protein n=1 Tax=Phaseolus vulgaris TaxID=3885 RepID=V7BH94_PHAVU|nr:hypothetical protein PHAVU_007G220000g [Phaseolus vulgaris]ESW17207.1 hypothetical protein PHAVU_007G220000g [Phaseolus vulgaris]
MTHQENQAKAISDEVRDEMRLYECARKYEIILKQFDELVGIMNNDTTLPKAKWRKGRRGASGERTSNQSKLQTVTRFLHQLRTKPTDSEISPNQ